MLRVPIEVSARHVHLTQAHIQKLFGHDLTVLKPISQKGQFAANETVKIRNSKFEIRNVRVVGPARPESQVELALSDCRILGLKNVLVKVSGNLRKSPGIILIGSKGKAVLRRGVIVAQRHIHCPPEKAKKFGEGQRVSVRVAGERGVVLENVIVRVRKDFVWRMHIDADEANAAGIPKGGMGIIMRT